MVLPPRFELGFAASETAALSIELREQSEVGAFKSARVRQRSKTLSLWQRRFIVDFWEPCGCLLGSAPFHPCADFAQWMKEITTGYSKSGYLDILKSISKKAYDLKKMLDWRKSYFILTIFLFCLAKKKYEISSLYPVSIFKL